MWNNVIFCVIVSCMMLVSCGESDSDKIDNSQALVREYYRAVSSDDWVTVGKCWGQDMTQSKLENMELFYEFMNTTISNLTITPVELSEYRTTLSADFDIKIVEGGEITEDSHKTMVLELERSLITGQWIIIEEYDAAERQQDNAVTELLNVELAVYSLMEDPQTPIYDLTSDSRLACGDGDCVMCDEDPALHECTRLMANVLGSLIMLSNNPGEWEEQVKPLSEYLHSDITEYYYCVNADGYVEGFRSDGSKIER